VPDLYLAMKDLKEGISGGFWDEARHGFEDLFIRSTALSDALIGTSHAVGGFWGALFEGMAKDEWSKAMQGDFAKLNDGIKIMTDSSGVFLNILKTLGEFGTTYVPKLAQGFVDMSTKFDAFLTRAQADGSLKRWVDDGVQGFKDLGKIIGELGSIFGGLADAAQAAGGASLGSLADGLENLSKAIHTADFQKNLTDIFEGSYEAMQHVKNGLHDVMGAIGFLAPTLKDVEIKVGSTIETLAKGIAKMVARPEVAKGLEDMFSGIEDGVKHLEVAIDPIGNKLGSVMSFVGELVRNLGDILGHAAAVLIPPIQHMLETIQPLIPMFGSIVKSITDNLAPVLDSLANDIVPPLVKEFEKIAPPVERIIKAVTPYVTALLESFSKSLKSGDTGAGAQKDADGINELAKSIEDGQKPFKDMLDWFNSMDKATSDTLKMQPVIDWHDGVVGMWKDLNDGAVGFNKDMRRNADETWGPFNKAVEKMNTDVNKALDDFWSDVDKNNKGFSEDFKKNWDTFWGGLDGFNKDTSKKVNDDLADFWADAGRNNEGMGKDFMSGWDGMWKDFGKATKPVADTAGKIQEHLGKLWGSLVSRPIDNFVKDFNKGWEKLKSDNQKLSGDINKNVSKWWGDLGNDFKKGADNIGKNWDKAWGDLKNGNQKASADINKSVSKWWGDLGNDFNKGAGNIKKNWDKAWGDLKSGNQKISADINKNVSKWWGDISAPFVKKGGEIAKNWDKTWNDIKSNNEKLSSDINKAVSDWWNDLSSDFTRGAKSIGDGWDGMWKDLVRGASELAADIQKGIDKFWADVQHAWEEGMKIVKDVEERGWDAVFEYLDGLWGDMLNSGGHIIDGLVQGIQDGIGAVGRAIASVGQTVLDGIAHIMDMHSPSREMFKRGQWVVMGLSDGIEAHADLAVAATNKMSQRVLEAARIKVPAIQTSGMFATPGDPNIFAVGPNGSSMPTPQSYGYNKGVYGSSVVQPTVNVYPSAPLNETQVGRMAASQLYWAFTNQR
jgi:phage-related protein